LAFSKLEALLRKAAGRAVEKVWSDIGRRIGAATPDE